MVGALALGAGLPPAIVAGAGTLAATTAAVGSAIWHPEDRVGRRVGRAAVIGLLAMGVGALVVAGRGAIGSPSAAGAAVMSVTRSAAPFEAVVAGVGSPKAAEQIAVVRIEAAPAGGSALVEALLPRYPEIGVGDRIRVQGSIEPPRNDDFGAYLRRIGAAGSLRSPILEVVAGPDGPAGLLDAIRQGSAEALTRALPEPQAGLAAGILVGLRERVDRDLAAAFTTAGVSHIVAISGWNIAIVAALVTAVLGGRIGTGPRTLITLATIAGYTLVAGASPSVNRAAVMATIGLTARAAGRSSSALSALGWAVIALLLVDPGTVNDPGFALSGLATAGLIAWSGPLSERLGHLRGRRLPGWLAESLAISLAAEAATLPVVLLTFGRLAIVAPLANLAIVPLVPPAMAAGALALLGGWLGAIGVPSVLVTILGLPAWALFGLMIALVRLAASLPLASILLAPPWNIGAAAIAAGLVVSAASGHWRVGRVPASTARST